MTTHTLDVSFRKRALLRVICATTAIVALVTLIGTSASAEDKFRRTYAALSEAVFIPPDLPPDLPPWPEVDEVYECTLEPETEREYIMLEAISLRTPGILDSLPGYIQEAIAVQNKVRQAEARPGERVPMLEATHMLRFISYRDMTQLVLLMNAQSKKTHPIFRRFHWVEEVSGIQYDGDGVPYRDETGQYTYRRRTTWMSKRHLEENQLVVPKVMIDAFVQGLYNKDPRVRLQCLSILTEMGPTPYVQEILQAAGGLKDEGLGDSALLADANETVGDFNRGYMATAAITNDEIQKNREKSPDGSLREGAGRLLTRRYVYCDIDGLPHWDVPFVKFTELNRKIDRMRVAHALEITRSIGPDQMQMIDAETFLTLTDSIAIRGAYGVNRSTKYGIAPHRAPSGQIVRGDRDFDGIISEEEDNILGQEIPRNQYTRGQSYFRKYGPKVLMPFAPMINKEMVQETNLSDKDMRDLIVSVFGALEHRNWQVRRRAAEFLYELYRSGVLSAENQRLIRNATLASVILRETMKEEFIPYKRVVGLHMYVNDPDFIGLKGDVMGYDREYGDLFLEPYNRSADINRTHTPVERRRTSDGTVIGVDPARVRPPAGSSGTVSGDGAAAASTSTTTPAAGASTSAQPAATAETKPMTEDEKLANEFAKYE